MTDTVGKIDAVFKDDSPQRTVERIKGILKAHNIETVEKWFESGVPGCYSLRVTVFGTVFGTNGKGVTRELALASGYGELMERLQIGRIFKSDQQKDGGLYIGGESDTALPAEELFQRTSQWYEMLARQAKLQTGDETTAEKILWQYADTEGNVAVTPFYCVNRKNWEYLPTTMLNALYTTNGCAAGNTMEEAVVQAISEIVERQFSLRILTEGIPVPDVPEDVLRTYRTSYQIITYLRDHNFKVVVKDCSLGTKFPVVCVCLIDQETGKYHTHFGAYPNFEIALQRTLTESFQGHSIQDVARINDFLPKGDGTFNLGNLVNQLVKGVSEKKPEFFLDTATQYQPCPGFSGSNNKVLLKECIAFLTQGGYDILVRDCSSLGFPTYQVIVPGYSEVFTHRVIPKHNDMQYHSFGAPVLRDPSRATIEQIMGYLMDMHRSAKRQLGVVPFSQQANIPVQLTATEETYLRNATLAHLHYTLDRKAEAAKCVEKMLTAAKPEDTEMLLCIKRYLSLCGDGYALEKIWDLLNFFHKPATVAALKDTVTKGGNPFDRFVLHCDMQCSPACVLFGACVKKQTDSLAQLVNRKLQEIDAADVKARIDQAIL